MDVDSLLAQLEKNILIHDGKRYLVAGPHQFKTIWIRDISFAFLAILDCPKEIWKPFLDIMINTIELFVNMIREEDGLGPKCMDTRNPELRCIYESVRHALLTRTVGIERVDGPEDPDSPLYGMYKDGRGSSAVDSNVLMYLVAVRMGLLWTHPELESLLLGYYTDKRMKTESGAPGLFTQAAYSDWQDSRDRSPATFHLNLLLWRALSQTPRRRQEAEALKKEMISRFKEEGDLYYAMLPPEPQICLEDQLLAIQWGFHGEDLFQALCKHPLWTSSFIPGFPTSPSYETNPHWQVEFAWLHHYHDEIFWSWLISFSGWMAYKLGDVKKAEAIHQALDLACKRDKGISEIYDVESSVLKQYERFTYQAEMPWTWGVAYALRFAVFIN